MKKWEYACFVIPALVFLASACASPDAAPNVEATIQAAVQATLTAKRSAATPTSTPSTGSGNKELYIRKMKFTSPEQYEEVDPRLLAADTKNYVGKRVLIKGKVLGNQHSDGLTWAQIMAEVKTDKYMTQSVSVYIYPRNTSVLEGERFHIYGKLTGSEEQTLKLTGAKVTTPVVVAHYVDYQSFEKR